MSDLTGPYRTVSRSFGADPGISLLCAAGLLSFFHLKRPPGMLLVQLSDRTSNIPEGLFDPPRHSRGCYCAKAAQQSLPLRPRRGARRWAPCLYGPFAGHIQAGSPSRPFSCRQATMLAPVSSMLFRFPSSSMHFSSRSSLISSARLLYTPSQQASRDVELS